MKMLRKNNGFARIITMFFILFTGVIAMVIIPSAQIQQNLIHNLSRVKKAEYAAEAGIFWGELVVQKNDLSFPVEKNIPLTSDLNFTINITKDGEDYLLKAEGVFKKQKVVLHKKRKF